MKPHHGTAVVIISLVLSGFSLFAQQTPDTLYIPKVSVPKYAPGQGPVVMVDEAHHNFHTTTNRFKPFANLLRHDGYKLIARKEQISAAVLGGVGILVISNALHENNIEEWTLPNPPAFTEEEIDIIKEWVSSGGSLLLIADHMPFPGAAEKLASVFGFTFYNGFALTDKIVYAPELFCKANGRLKDHPITAPLDSILTFTGQGFEIPDNAQPLLALDDAFYILLPETAWKFSDETPRIDGDGKFQGATLAYGKGKVAVFGEAAAFSAQISQGMFHMGFNHPHAKHNAQFVLNVIHWLDE